MAYFRPEFLQFLRALKENNIREWYHENKERFYKDVKEPFEAFTADLIDRLHARDNRILMTPKEAVFRIYRDIRFSKDKTPYKTHMAAGISPGGRKNWAMPGLYVQFGADDARIYSGTHMLERDQLQNLRYHIAAHPEKFNKLINDEKFVESFGEIRGEKNKRLPKEFREAAEQQPLLFNKAFYYFKKFPAEIVLEEDLMDTILFHYDRCTELNRFFEEGVQADS